jgi:hypothetical protein
VSIYSYKWQSGFCRFPCDLLVNILRTGDICLYVADVEAVSREAGWAFVLSHYPDAREVAKKSTGHPVKVGA